ncbi:MAG: hypothetical protein LBQ83_04910 [Candidatus Margulisbacteria bacterium]|jgi:hypothetical protein|nr:hypothetical protein [Candidatus Margulisiibacteriota bacterium]
MFRKLALLILLLGALAAAGYKEFAWGLSPAQVTAVVPDLRASSPDTPPPDEFFALSRLLFPKLITFGVEQTDKKLFAPEQKRAAYSSKDRALIFYFEEEKLFGVAVDFSGVNPYTELAGKYGARTKTRFLRGNNYAYDACLWVIPERVIFYSGMVLKPGFGNVYYFDPQWLLALQQKLQGAPAEASRID